MKKMAIFVEGQTERIFAERLLSEIASSNGLQVTSYVASGGGRSGLRTLTQIKVSGPAIGFNHFVMIVDCGTDNRVRSDIGDHYDGLVAQGFSSIIGIRDLYPDFKFADIAKVRTGLNFLLKTNPIQVLFALGIMEIESWFIAEHTHFQRLSPALTVQLISANLGFDADADDLQLRPNPAVDLHNAYHLVGFVYNKSRRTVERTVGLLDYARLYIETRDRFPDLQALVENIDDFLS